MSATIERGDYPVYNEKEVSRHEAMAKAIQALLAAEGEEIRLRRALSEANNSHVTALNEVNAIQKEIDGLIKEIRSNSVHGSDWRRNTQGARIEQT